MAKAVYSAETEQVRKQFDDPTDSAVDSYTPYLACTSKATQKPEMKLKTINNRTFYIKCYTRCHAKCIQILHFVQAQTPSAKMWVFLLYIIFLTDF